MILIVGATGVLGREAAKQLLAAGHAVRVMTRTPDKARDLAALDAEVIRGDLTDLASLANACAGAHAVLATAHALQDMSRHRSEQVDDAGHRALIDAAKAANVERFVYISVIGASPDNPIDFFRTKAQVENHLKASALTHTILRSPAFMEWHVHNLLGKSLIDSGKTTIFGDGNNPINFIAGVDAARFAVLGLTDPRTANRTLAIGGPDNVTKRRVAGLYANHLQHPVTVNCIPTRLLRTMAPIVRPIHPVVSRLMALSVWAETTDQRFDTTALLNEFPMSLVRVDDFVRERVAEAAGTPRH